MFVGYTGQGKTTLLNHMVNTSKRPPQGIFTYQFLRAYQEYYIILMCLIIIALTSVIDEVKPTVGVTLMEAWIYTPRPSVDPAITFYPWDFSGQVSYYKHLIIICSKLSLEYSVSFMLLALILAG